MKKVVLYSILALLLLFPLIFAKELPKLTSAKVIRIIDGDTFEVKIGTKIEKIRLIGVNCPENTTKTEPFGVEATKFATSMLLNKNVFLEYDVQYLDKYGRLLAYVWLAPPKEINEKEIRNKMFNAIVLLNGFAQVMTVPPNVKYVDYFVKFQKEAREKNKGLWSIDKVFAKGATYIGNVKTKIFHHFWCKYVQKMNEKNKVYFKTREEAIKSGYRPCKVCNP